LPLDLKPNSVYVPKINEKPTKNIGKVSVIIPTKDKFELISECISSFYEHCNPDLFDIFIADTGSTDENKEKLKSFISEYNNIKLIEYDYYNFAKINNDVVKNHLNNTHEYLLFCNNDIKLLNNVIYGMLKIFKTTPKVGTVGCRLHYSDNTVQHDGMVFYIHKNNVIQLTHMGLKGYYTYTPSLKKVLGSTAALLMVNKTVFEKCGYFNENYQTCLEDAELNIKCLSLGLTNYYDGNLVAYHYESQTRVEGQDDYRQDYINTFHPFMIKHENYIKPFIFKLN
jgi:GT2 family glycosyltransferase